MLAFKVFRSSEYAEFRERGESEGAPVDLADGYIHLSTRDQLDETLAKHFSDERGLHLLAVETEALGADLRWEPSRGGALFPHLYRTLTQEDVLWAAPIPLYNGVHLVPDGPA